MSSLLFDISAARTVILMKFAAGDVSVQVRYGKVAESARARSKFQQSVNPAIDRIMFILQYSYKVWKSRNVLNTKYTGQTPHLIR